MARYCSSGRVQVIVGSFNDVRVGWPDSYQVGCSRRIDYLNSSANAIKKYEEKWPAANG